MQFQEEAMMGGQQDVAFLSLLSSQRKLLNRLNSDNTRRSSENLTRTNLRNSLVTPEGQFHMNQPITDNNQGNELLFSKRLSQGSIGMGSDHLSFGFDPFGDSCHQSRPDGQMDGLFGKVNLDGVVKGKKRRLSNLRFSATLFEDNLKLLRGTSGLFEKQVQVKEPYENRRLGDIVEQRNFGDDTDDDLSFFESVEELVKQPIMLNQPRRPDSVKAKGVMEAFITAMESSQKSQQAIHDWDRKMGLKRSHSKTMRLTTRSRKKLRSTIRKEINALSSRKWA